MKIDLNKIDQNQFKIKEGELFGRKCFLINPSLSGMDWNKDNLHFRSLLVSENGNIVSCGYKKFFNALEKPLVDPWDNNWPCHSYEKLDGSLLIVSSWGGRVIHRTRGTFNAETLDNGHEITFLKEKYPKVFEPTSDHVSMFYEWQTLSNKIVLDPPTDPTLTLIGGIRHHSLDYLNDLELDEYDRFHVQTGRPKKYYHNNLTEALEDVKLWEGKEGIVINSPDWQVLKKVKSDQYLKLHYFLTQLNENGVIDLICQNKQPNKESFYKIVEDQTDFETFTFVKPLIDKIYNHIEEIEKDKEAVIKKVSKMTGDRKEIAEEVCSRYKDWRRAFAFRVLDNSPELEDRVFKKILKTKLDENSINS